MHRGCHCCRRCVARICVGFNHRSMYIVKRKTVNTKLKKILRLLTSCTAITIIIIIAYGFFEWVLGEGVDKRIKRNTIAYDCNSCLLWRLQPTRFSFLLCAILFFEISNKKKKKNRISLIRNVIYRWTNVLLNTFRCTL